MKAFAAALCLALLGFPAAAQIEAGSAEVVHPNQRVTVPALATITAGNGSRSSVAKAAVAIALSASQVSCEPGSPLESVLDASSGLSLQALAGKVSGASCITNGRPERVSATFTPGAAIQADNIIASLMQRRPLLLSWNSALYVLYGVVYDEHRRADGSRVNVVRELLLIDPRYSDGRRLVSFQRGKDNLAEVEGIASVRAGESTRGQ